jgi:hypothetical protein
MCDTQRPDGANVALFSNSPKVNNISDDEFPPDDVIDGGSQLPDVVTMDSAMPSAHKQWSYGVNYQALMRQNMPILLRIWSRLSVRYVSQISSLGVVLYYVIVFMCFVASVWLITLVTHRMPSLLVHMTMVLTSAIQHYKTVKSVHLSMMMYMNGTCY